MADLSDADQARLQWMQRWRSDMSGYAILQSTRPQTLAYALTDSQPASSPGSWRNLKEWTNPDAELPEGAVDHNLIRWTKFQLSREGGPVLIGSDEDVRFVNFCALPLPGS